MSIITYELYKKLAPDNKCYVYTPLDPESYFSTYGKHIGHGNYAQWMALNVSFDYDIACYLGILENNSIVYKCNFVFSIEDKEFSWDIDKFIGKKCFIFYINKKLFSGDKK